MALGEVSTATAAWYNGTLVGAYGSSSAVLAELAAGASSSASLQSREHLMAWGMYFDSESKVTSAGALWWINRNAAEWGVHPSVA